MKFNDTTGRNEANTLGNLFIRSRFTEISKIGFSTFAGQIFRRFIIQPEETFSSFTVDKIPFYENDVPI